MRTFRKLFLPLIIMLLILTVSCAGKSGTSETAEASAFIPAKVFNLEPEEALSFIAAREPVILDVRTEAEYDSGHIENAVLIPVQILDEKLAELEKYKESEIFVYCRSGNRSATASRMLTEAGFEKVYNLLGGINGWVSQGNKTVK